MRNEKRGAREKTRIISVEFDDDDEERQEVFGVAHLFFWGPKNFFERDTFTKKQNSDDVSR